MKFDAARVPGGDVAGWGNQCRDHALTALDNGDWRGVYEWTKSWVGWGGGAWLPDTWLLYAASAMLKRQPKNAVHSLDLGLKTWIEGPADRAVLVWCRGALVWKVLADPKTAVTDLDLAEPHLPAWLEADVATQVARCQQDARVSRKRVPSVKPHPELSVPPFGRGFAAPPVVTRADGARPQVWDNVARYFSTE